MHSFPLPDHCLPGLEPLLRGSLWADWVAAGRVFPVEDLHASIGYLRLKPETSCRVTVIGTSGGKGERPPRGFLLHLYPDPERAQTAFDKVTRREAVIGEDGLEPFLDTKHCVVAAPFPNDPELPSLRHVYDPTRFRRALSKTRPPAYPAGEWRLQKRHIRTELLAYKPGRRAVFRVRVGVRHEERDEKVRLYWHVKVGTPEVTAANDATARWFHAAVGETRDWRVPTPWGLIADRSWISTEWVVGDHVDQIAAAKRVERLLRVGKALAELHGLEGGGPPALTPSLALTTEASALSDLAGDLAHLLPPEAPRILSLGKKIAERLPAIAAAPVTVVHGDFHRDQIVFEGDRAVLVDLDRAGIGAPILDLGAFLASGIAAGSPSEEGEAFLSGYESGRPPVDRSLLASATAHQLYRRAIFPFRNLEPEWPRRMATLLDEVDSLLA